MQKVRELICSTFGHKPVPQEFKTEVVEVNLDGQIWKVSYCTDTYCARCGWEEWWPI